ncbi:hypothetical protein B0H21DRAFT_574698 [Amylocystis lapponica]|nr:hypothetical protein B0H21DRAFT_574698 [Amylocystis lapponica]
MTSPLAGKVAVVTGSSRSIGAAVARRLAADGANVIVNYVSNGAAADTVVESINNNPAPGTGKAVSVQADVATAKGGQRLLDAAFSTFGGLDILVLNAAVMENATLQEVSEEFFDRHFTVNVKAPFFLVQAAAPRMKAGGRIILFSTSLTRNSMLTPNYLVYVATKGAVDQITRVLAKELGPRGITVNTVSPGPIDTDMFRDGKTEQVISALAAMHPLKRIGEVDEVSPVVAFLAREDANWVNGQILLVNGGFTV